MFGVGSEGKEMEGVRTRRLKGGKERKEWEGKRFGSRGKGRGAKKGRRGKKRRVGKGKKGKGHKRKGYGKERFKMITKGWEGKGKRWK